MTDIDEDTERLLRKEVTKSFQMHAFELKRETVSFLVSLFANQEKEKRQRWISKMIEVLKKQNLKSPLISEEQMRNTFKQCRSRGIEDIGKLVNVFDVFSVKPFDYDGELNKMVLRNKPISIGAASSSFTHAQRQRFIFVKQRASRCTSLKAIKFTTIDSLCSAMRKVQSVVILGMLTHKKADCMHIEDLTGCLEIELTEETKFHQALFTEGIVAIFEGCYDGGVLKVNEVALVPVESAESSRKQLGSQENWFGGDEKIAFRCNERLRAATIQHAESSIVIVSDVFLDDPKIMKALYSLLDGYSTSPPVAYILCGNFCSRPKQPDTMQLMDQGFRWLSNQLNEFKDAYQNTQFIFVPGPDDPFVNMVLPRPALPPSFFKHLQPIENCVFASNPARIQYASQEIVVFRENIIEKMCKHTINSITAETIPSSFSKTILSQTHLCPLPMYISPVMPDLNHVMSLFPLPDLVVTADRFESFVETVAGADTIVTNPGSFARSNLTFQVYYPQQRKVEASQIPA